MNLYTKQKQTHRHRKQTCGYRSGGGKGQIGGMGLRDKNYYMISNEDLLYSTGNYT